MKTNQFSIQLQQPVIISQQSASVGAHQSLDYIKGSTILGLVASRLYAKLSTDEAFETFHSGKVRFCDALPMATTEEVGYPVPMNLHTFKAEKYAEGEDLLADKIFDVSKITKQDLNGKQPVQLRNFYLTHSGKRISPNKEQTLKTAIDPKKNRAKDAQLFGYEALSANQSFQFSIYADDDVSDELWQKIIQAITGKARLGRSRSAQFGMVTIKQIENEPNASSVTNAKDNILTLWLVGDMQLHNDGQPSLQPLPKLLGLPEGTEWMVDSSFIRTRRYSMYNAYRKHYDKERQVISRGSVLRYQLPADFSEYDELIHQLQSGIGLQTENGLGQVLINPEFLQETNPIWQQANNPTNNTTKPNTESVKTITNPNSTLIATLQNRQTIAEIGTAPREIASEVFSRLCDKVAQARLYQGLVKGMILNPTPPSRTQFGRFKEMANQYRNDNAGLWEQLITAKNAMLKVESEDTNTNRQSGKSYNKVGWEVKYTPIPTASLGMFLQEELKQHKDKPYFAYIIAELAILGLSDTWEEYCLGIKPTWQDNKNNKQNNAQKNKEQA